MLSPPGLFFPSSNPFSLFSSRAQSYLRTYRCLHAHLRLRSYPCLHAHLRLHAHQKKDHDTVQAVDGSRAFTAVPAVPHSGSDAHVSSQQVLSPEIKKKWHIDLYKLDHYGQIRNFQFLYRRFWEFSTVGIGKIGFLSRLLCSRSSASLRVNSNGRRRSKAIRQKPFVIRPFFL